MEHQIFREKSLDKIKSPENLNDYIKVASPGVWLLLVAVIALLSGACIWGIFGHIDTSVKTTAFAEEGKVMCYVNEDTFNKLTSETQIIIDSEVFPIASIATNGPGSGVYSITCFADIKDGVYEAEIIIESVAPIFFVLN